MERVSRSAGRRLVNLLKKAFMIERIAILGTRKTARMKRFCMLFLPLTAFPLSLTPLAAAQDVWKVIPMETPVDHRPLPFMRAIGIPATATYKGKKRKAFVFISGREKAKGGPGQPAIEIYVEGLGRLVPEVDLELFEGPDSSEASTEIRVSAVSITRGKQVYRATNSVDLYMGEYSESIVGQDGNNVLGTGILSKGPRRSAWIQLLHEMSSGFDEGHISIGGKVLSPNIEIDFSGKGIEPLLQELLRVIGP